MTQLPAVQICPAAHARSQPPQCARSVWVSRHELLHTVCPAGQLVTQVPPVQICPAVHARPHMPQLVRSVWVSRHAPLHAVCPVGHEVPQPLFTHT
jgi:hypothetical protein